MESKLREIFFLILISNGSSNNICGYIVERTASHKFLRGQPEEGLKDLLHQQSFSKLYLLRQKDLTTENTDHTDKKSI